MSERDTPLDEAITRLEDDITALKRAVDAADIIYIESDEEPLDVADDPNRAEVRWGEDAPPQDVREQIEADIGAFKDTVANADVVYVGKDTEYVPDSPRLREDFPNYDGEEETDG